MKGLLLATLQRLGQLPSGTRVALQGGAAVAASSSLIAGRSNAHIAFRSFTSTPVQRGGCDGCDDSDGKGTHTMLHVPGMRSEDAVKPHPGTSLRGLETEPHAYAFITHVMCFLSFLSKGPGHPELADVLKANQQWTTRKLAEDPQ